MRSQGHNVLSYRLSCADGEGTAARQHGVARGRSGSPGLLVHRTGMKMTHAAGIRNVVDCITGEVTPCHVICDVRICCVCVCAC